jgi:outer membrane protein assembly factor BamB
MARQDLEQAAVHEKKAEWGAAARRYRTYLQQESDLARRAEALAHLALCYEKQHVWPAAQHTWLQLAREAGDRSMSETISKGEIVRDYVERHLKQVEFHPAERNPDAYAVTWHSQQSTAERLIDGQGSQDRRTPVEWFTTRGKFVICRETDTGKIRWSAEVPGAPVWGGRYLDLVVLGGPDAVHCLSIADGEVVWKVACLDERGRFSTFQLKGDRLYCLHGLNRLVAVNAVTGRVLWIASAPPGSQVLPQRQAGFFPSFLATEKHVVVYTELGGALILDAADGTQLQQLRPVSAPGTLGRPPAPIPFGNGEKVCLAVDLDHIIGFDLHTLTELWRYELPFAANRTGAWPLCIKSGDGIAVAAPVNFGLIDQRLDPGTGKAISDKLRHVSCEDLLWHKAVSVDPPARQYNFRWLLLSVQCDCEPITGAGTFSVVLLDDRTGKEVHRLAFHPEASHRPLSLRFAFGFSWRPQLGLAASTSAGPCVCRYADGLIVTLGKDAWRLSPKSTP